MTTLRVVDDVAALLQTDRAAMALTLRDRLPGMIEAEQDAAARAGYRRGLAEVLTTIPSRAGGGLGKLKPPGWLLSALCDPKAAAVCEATGLERRHLQAMAVGAAALGPGLITKARAALGVQS